MSKANVVKATFATANFANAKYMYERMPLHIGHVVICIRLRAYRGAYICTYIYVYKGIHAYAYAFAYAYLYVHTHYHAQCAHARVHIEKVDSL